MGNEYGIAMYAQDPVWNGNAFWSNKSGNRNGFDDMTTSSINGMYPPPGGDKFDVYLTNNPFVNDTGGNFSLNSTANAGALITNTAIPGIFPGGANTGYASFGAVQPIGGSSSTINIFPVFD